MDLEPAEPATSRRGLLRVAGAAGIVGAAALVARPAAAIPNPPTDADTALLEQAMLLELTAHDLYLEAILSSSFDAETAQVMQVLSENHEAFAQAIAGVAGLSANGRNDAVFAALSSEFSSDVLLAAHGLEQTAVATHTELLGIYESLQSIELTASLLVIEARHATVLADLAGVSDLDVVFGNEQSPLDLAEAVA